MRRIESAQQTANAIITQQAIIEGSATPTQTVTATITPTPNGLSRAARVFAETQTRSAMMDVVIEVCSKVINERVRQ